VLEHIRSVWDTVAVLGINHKLCGYPVKQKASAQTAFWHLEENNRLCGKFDSRKEWELIKIAERLVSAKKRTANVAIDSNITSNIHT
jgi:hypothetical protein